MLAFAGSAAVVLQKLRLAGLVAAVVWPKLGAAVLPFAGSAVAALQKPRLPGLDLAVVAKVVAVVLPKLVMMLLGHLAVLAGLAVLAAAQL